MFVVCSLLFAVAASLSCLKGQYQLLGHYEARPLLSLSILLTP
jgi:hypothetical protein